MLTRIHQALLGSPLATGSAGHERLSNVQALAVLSSDALSSVAYATEEILLVLILAGTQAMHLSLPVALGIAALLVVVAFSYHQTIHAYPAGGGAYSVSKDNLGTNLGLIAGAALLIDYVLTVAVSVSAGIAAITSAFPATHPYRVPLALAALAGVTLVNLRGVRESGKVFTIPTYLFVTVTFLLIVTGLVRLLTGSLQPHTSSGANPSTPLQSLTVFLVLRAFASGCTALTGVEAISNGVTVFHKPEPDNAGRTLLWMAAILVTMFLGLTFLANRLNLTPIPGETVISQIARDVFGHNVLYYAVQAATALILLLAANTSYSDFPRLANLIARDDYLPRQLSRLGDRLVYANGILLLATVAATLIVVFRAETHALIPLYAVGVFISFTLSQSGMVVRWLRLQTPGWRRAAVVNAVGAMTTGGVLIVVALTKFVHGAWITFLLILGLALGFRAIHKHYKTVADQLSIAERWPTPMQNHTIIVPVDEVHRGLVKAVRYAQTLRGTLRAVTVAVDPTKSDALAAAWNAAFPDLHLEVLPSPYRSVLDPLLTYINGFIQTEGDYVTVILPEFVPAHPWQGFLHNQTTLDLRRALLAVDDHWHERYRVITNVRFFLTR